MKDCKIHGDLFLHLVKKKKTYILTRKFSSMKVFAKILLAICN